MKSLTQFILSFCVFVISSTSIYAQGWPSPCFTPCEQVPWKGPTTFTVQGSNGCPFTYTVYWRTACGINEMSIVELQHVSGFQACTFDQMYKDAMEDFVRNHRNDPNIAFGPNGEGCSSEWRITGGACWRHFIQTSNGINFLTYQPCNDGLCCWTKFTVCEDGEGDIGIAVTSSKAPAPSEEDCETPLCSDFVCEILKFIEYLDDGPDYDPGV